MSTPAPQADSVPGRVVLVTGSEGFIGKNLCQALRRLPNAELLGFEVNDSPGDLPGLASRADIIFHLAGVNRPQTEADFAIGNAELTRELCRQLAAGSRKPVLVLSSSTQAELDNAYGASKRVAETAVLEYHTNTGAPVYIYRFPNVFGKWSRPNYNSVVATFCHNIARGLPVQVNNPATVLRFVYIDDVVHAFVDTVVRPEHDPTRTRYEIEPVLTITLGELHDLVQSFPRDRALGRVPNLGDPLTRYLHATFLSFVPPSQLATPVPVRSDSRGRLFEVVKSPHGGQVFVSTTKPGVTRGNHYHDTKVEKFAVIAGEAIIRLHPIRDGEPIEFAVNGQDVRVIDIPPGYAHSIENVGQNNLVTLFWASEVFDPERPDTWAEPVVPQRPAAG